MRKILTLIFVFAVVFFSSGKTVFSATTDKDFTLDDGTTDSPQLNLKDQDDFSLILQKNDAGEAVILNNESSGVLRLIPSNDTDDYIYLSTSSDLSGFFWDGVAAYTNDPAIRISASGKLEYRDQDELTYTPFDSLAAGVATLNDLSDVVITGGAQGDIIYFNGTNWVNLGPGTSGQVLQTQGAGANPLWAAGTAASLSGLSAATVINTIDSLNFAQTWNWSTANTQTPLSMSANALTSGTLLSLSSSATALTGDVSKIELTGANAGNTGNVLKVGFTGTAGTATAVNVTNAGTGLGMRVNDDGTYTDTTPVVVDAAGNLGVGTSVPDRLLHSEVSDSGTSAVVYAERASHITSGTAGTGFGVGQEFELENASGTNVVSAAIEIPYTDATNASEDADFNLKLVDAGTLSTRFTVTSDGNVGVGDSTPASLLTVGSGDKFQVDTNGDMVKIKNVTYSWPAADASGVLTSNGSGTLSWTAAAAGDISSIGDVASGAAFDGTQGTTLTFNDSDGDQTVAYDTTNNKFVISDNISIGSAGVDITTDGDGAITFLGLGDGTDEDLTFNFDDTSNQIDVTTSTGVTSIELNSIDLIVPTEVYDATGWNADLSVPTKDAVRDQIESLAAASGDITAVGDVLTGAAFTQTAGNDGNSLYFEGATANGNEILLTANDPGSDITVTIPATAGTLVTTGDSGTVTSMMINDNTITGTDTEDDTFDFVDFEDTLDLDTALTLNQIANAWSQTFTGTTTVGLTYTANSLTSGSAVSVASSATALTGDLNKVELTGAGAGNTGNVLKVGFTGTAGTATAVNVTNAGTGLSFRVNDDGTYTDTTPVVVDASGNVGIGTSSPDTTFEINGTYSMTPSTLTSLAGGAQITVTQTVMRVKSTGGAVVLGTPAVVAGADGQMVTILGASDTDTVQFVDNAALQLTGGVPFTMGTGDSMVLVYDSSLSAWVELNRSNN